MNSDCNLLRSRLEKARERLLEATGEYALPHGGQLDEVTGMRKQTRVRDLQFKASAVNKNIMLRK